ncbi:UNVERIFIED_CONTAM: hypothetical protein PYX00_008193 [Menopon gallinae]|uniref:Reverse transcriptase domain-containing protein n=1 Tax=Menopon gallinae TaxID=328185 RepID=A0AAW2HMX9_9NEOP
MYGNCRSCVRIKGAMSQTFPVVVELHQGCMLSPLLSITYMDRMLQRIRGTESFRYGHPEAGHPVNADDLLGYTQSQLQRAIDGFDAVYAEAGMEISWENRKSWRPDTLFLYIKMRIIIQTFFIIIHIIYDI